MYSGAPGDPTTRQLRTCLTIRTLSLLCLCSANRNNSLQSVRRQVVGRALWRDNVRGLQGLLQAISELGGQLPVPEEQAVRRRPRQQEPMPVLSVAKVPKTRDESRW